MDPDIVVVYRAVHAGEGVEERGLLVGVSLDCVVRFALCAGIEDTSTQNAFLAGSRLHSRLTELKDGMPSFYSDILLDSGPQFVKLSRGKTRQANSCLCP